MYLTAALLNIFTFFSFRSHGIVTISPGTYSIINRYVKKNAKPPQHHYCCSMFKEAAQCTRYLYVNWLKLRAGTGGRTRFSFRRQCRYNDRGDVCITRYVFHNKIKKKRELCTRILSDIHNIIRV